MTHEMSELQMEQDMLTVAASPCAVLAAEPAPELGSHLVRLGATDWALWRWVGLRGAGFAAAEVERLSAPECATAADELIEAEAEFELAREDAVEALRQELDRAQADDRAVLEKALRRVRKGKLPAPLADACAASAALDRLRWTQARIDAARLAFSRE